MPSTCWRIIRKITKIVGARYRDEGGGSHRDADEGGVIRLDKEHSQGTQAAQDTGLDTLTGNKFGEGGGGEGDHVRDGAGHLGGNIGLQQPPALAQQFVPAGKHIDGKDQGQHAGDQNGDQTGGELHQPGTQVGQDVQGVFEHTLQGGVQAGQVQLLDVQVQVFQQLVDGVLGVGDVAAQIEHKGLDALHQLGQHEGEQRHDQEDEGQVGGKHRQRPGGPTGGGFVQPTAVQPVKELTGPVEDKGQTEADDQRLKDRQ